MPDELRHGLCDEKSPELDFDVDVSQQGFFSMRHSQIAPCPTANRMSATLVLNSRLRAVDGFLKFLLKLLTSSNFKASDVFAIHLAVKEALVNAVKHGNEMDWQKRIHLRFVIDSTGFRIRIRDEGRGFDPETIPEITGAVERPIGRGLWLMRHYMHEVRFNAKGNRVTLVWRLLADRSPNGVEASDQTPW